MSTLPLAGRRAFVTGAASGIGAAVAARLSADGAAVTCVDVNAEAVHAVAERVGGTALVEDLSDTASVRQLSVDTDILVSNAGVQHVAPIDEFPLEKFDFVMHLMLHAPFLLVRAALPKMYERG